MGATALSVGIQGYSARGVPYQIQSSYGPLVTQTQLAADGVLTGQTYGDVAGTQLSKTYDAERRLQQYTLQRPAPTFWAAPPAGYTTPPVGAQPKVAANLVYAYDAAERLASVTDERNPAEWAPGTLPVTRTYGYDGFDRLTSVAYGYPNGASDPQIPETTASDPMPVPSRILATRVASQSFTYDWLGNTTSSTDDQSAFYDRSLGTIANGTAHPNQLVTATGKLYCVSEGGYVQCSSDSLKTVYDAAGNLTSMLVSRQPGTCTNANGMCSHRFVYDWDEVGQLARARRWDYTSATQDPFPAVPTGAAVADLQYAYSQGARVVKTARDAEGDTSTSLEVFSTLRLNSATYDAESNTYERDGTTETAYLAGGLARVVYAENDLPTLTSGNLHVFFELGDHLGSTSVVIDQATSEVVQASTYQAYGAPESDSSETRWGNFREDYRFTGKEDDRDVGLTYFGARYYHAQLGRWISPDPLAVHALRGDPNVYAYVHGMPSAMIDPTGLDGECNNPSGCTPPPPSTDDDCQDSVVCTDLPAPTGGNSNTAKPPTWLLRHQEGQEAEELQAWDAAHRPRRPRRHPLRGTSGASIRRGTTRWRRRRFSTTTSPVR